MNCSLRKGMFILSIIVLAFWGSGCREKILISTNDTVEIFYINGGGISGKIVDKFYVSTKSRLETEGNLNEDNWINCFFVSRAAESDFKKELNKLLIENDWNEIESIQGSASDARSRTLCVIHGKERRVVIMDEYLTGSDGTIAEFLHDKRFIKFRHLVSEIKTLAELYGRRETIRMPVGAWDARRTDSARQP